MNCETVHDSSVIMNKTIVVAATNKLKGIIGDVGKLELNEKSTTTFGSPDRPISPAFSSLPYASPDVVSPVAHGTVQHTVTRAVLRSLDPRTKIDFDPVLWPSDQVQKWLETTVNESFKSAKIVVAKDLASSLIKMGDDWLTNINEALEGLGYEEDVRKTVIKQVVDAIKLRLQPHLPEDMVVDVSSPKQYLEMLQKTQKMALHHRGFFELVLFRFEDLKVALANPAKISFQVLGQESLDKNKAKFPIFDKDIEKLDDDVGRFLSKSRYTITYRFCDIFRPGSKKTYHVQVLQSISENGLRNAFVDYPNASYPKLYTELYKLFLDTTLDSKDRFRDRSIGVLMSAILRCKNNTDQSQGNHFEKVVARLNRNQQLYEKRVNLLVHIVVLFFQVEVERNPEALLVHTMALELVVSKGERWVNVFVDPNSEFRFGIVDPPEKTDGLSPAKKGRYAAITRALKAKGWITKANIQTVRLSVRKIHSLGVFVRVENKTSTMPIGKRTIKSYLDCLEKSRQEYWIKNEAAITRAFRRAQNTPGDCVGTVKRHAVRTRVQATANMTLAASLGDLPYMYSKCQTYTKDSQDLVRIANDLEQNFMIVGEEAIRKRWLKQFPSDTTVDDSFLEKKLSDLAERYYDVSEQDRAQVSGFVKAHKVSVCKQMRNSLTKKLTKKKVCESYKIPQFLIGKRLEKILEATQATALLKQIDKLSSGFYKTKDQLQLTDLCKLSDSITEIQKELAKELSDYDKVLTKLTEMNQVFGLTP